MPADCLIESNLNSAKLKFSAEFLKWKIQNKPSWSLNNLLKKANKGSDQPAPFEAGWSKSFNSACFSNASPAWVFCFWHWRKFNKLLSHLVLNIAEQWKRCCDQVWLIDNRPPTQVHVDGTLLDVEPNFCYLGDMLCAGGGCKLAIITRCGIACGKFKGFFLCWHQSMYPSGPKGLDKQKISA